MKIIYYTNTDKSNVRFVIETNKGKFDSAYSYNTENTVSNFNTSIDNINCPDVSEYDDVDDNTFNYKQRDAFNSIVIEQTQTELPSTIHTFKEFLSCYKISLKKRIWLLIIVMMYKYDSFDYPRKIEFLELLSIYHNIDIKTDPDRLDTKYVLDTKYISSFLNKLYNVHVNTKINKV